MSQADSSTAQASARPSGAWARFHARHLFDYSPAATRGWLLLTLAGTGALAWALTGFVQSPAAQLWAVVGWWCVVAVAAAFPIPIPRSKHSVSPGEVLVFLLLALHGPAAAVMAAALEGLVGAVRTSTRLSSRIATTASSAAGMTLASVVFMLAQPSLVAAGLPVPASHLAALALAALAYGSTCTAALMELALLKRGQHLTLSLWLGNLSWFGTLTLLSAALAGMLSLNAHQFGHSSVVVGVLIIGLSLALLRMHFRQQITEHQAQEARVAAAEQESQQSQRRFHSAFTQASIGMAIVSADGRVLQTNRALGELLGRDTGALQGRPFAALLHAGDAKLLERQVEDMRMRRSERFSIELRCMGEGDATAWVSLHCAPFDDDSGGDPGGGLIFQVHDISSRRLAEGRLRHIAYHDPLTDLANRSRFQERLSEAVERSRTDRRSRFAVMMLDLDRFKLVNDTLGHGAGDELLKLVAQRLRDCVRPCDLVARLGGDEFAVLLEDTGPDDDHALFLGQRLLKVLDQPVRINGTELRPQASIGLTFSDMGYREPEEVLRDADLAMYQAKEDGKGRLALFNARLHEHLEHKLQLEADLRRAIGEGQLSLMYQPMFHLSPHRLAGFEALARWTHPTRGAISPGVFIALAEETGCIEALTAWAIDEAVRQHAQWHHEAPAAGLVMHVNVSGKDLARPQFVPHVRDVLQRHGLPPRLLVLEITESTLMEHRDQALQALSELCELGVKVGIDDFGTGYSSLAYLSTLPFDCLKIDRSFVIGMDKSRQNQEIVRTVISLGRSLNKEVVAEGIETADQLRRLRQLGATIGQGYGLSRPLVPAQVRELLLEPTLAPG